MILPVVLLSLTAAWTVRAQTPECPTCILVNTTCYNISHVLDLEANFRKKVVISKIGILRSKNILFYSFEPVFEDEEYYKIGFRSLVNESSAGVLRMLDGQVLNLGTFDIDQGADKIYFGGSDGIFVLDYNTSKLTSYSSRGDTITNLFFKNKVYFTRYDDRGIITKNGDYFHTFYENIPFKNFVITKYDVFIFLHFTGLYVAKGDVKHKISDNSFFRGITVDREGTVYAWWLDGIYKVVIDKYYLKRSKLVRVAELLGIGAMTFDNENNILYTVDRSLYIMKPISSGCEVIDTTTSQPE